MILDRYTNIFTNFLNDCEFSFCTSNHTMRDSLSFLSPFLVYNLVCCTRTFQFWRKFVLVTRTMNNDAIGARINQIDCLKYIQSVRNKGCCHNYRSLALFITVIKGEFDVDER